MREHIREQRVVVARAGGRIRAAFLFAVIGVSGIASVLYIRRLVVARHARGAGIGSRMLARIKHFTHRRDADGFFLFAKPTVARFYERNRLTSLFSFLFWWVRGIG